MSVLWVLLMPLERGLGSINTIADLFSSPRRSANSQRSLGAATESQENIGRHPTRPVTRSQVRTQALNLTIRHELEQILAGFRIAHATTRPARAVSFSRRLLLPRFIPGSMSHPGCIRP